MSDALALQEGARWFAAAAKNASDPRLKRPMQARARELARLANSPKRREDQAQPNLIEVNVGDREKAKLSAS